MYHIIAFLPPPLALTYIHVLYITPSVYTAAHHPLLKSNLQNSRRLGVRGRGKGDGEGKGGGVLVSLYKRIRFP